MKHTPGPWTVSDNLNNDMSRPVVSEEDRIAFVHLPQAMSDGRFERDANARLIAAAPVLLEALKAMLELPDAKERLEQVRRGIGTKAQNATLVRASAAIAKAEAK